VDASEANKVDCNMEDEARLVLFIVDPFSSTNIWSHQLAHESPRLSAGGHRSRLTPTIQEALWDSALNCGTVNRATRSSAAIALARCSRCIEASPELPSFAAILESCRLPWVAPALLRFDLRHRILRPVAAVS
jgi:hypothetical protein